MRSFRLFSMIILFLVLLLVCTCVDWFGSETAAQPALKPPAFDKKKLDAAETLIRDIFKEEFAQAKESKDARKKLAETLLEQSQGIKEEADVRFVALSLARDLAADAGDHATAFAAIVELTRHHQVDVILMKADALARVIDSTNEPGPAKKLVEMVLKMANDFADDDRFSEAVQYAQLAETAAKKTNDDNLLKAVNSRLDELTIAQQEIARIQPFLQKLKSNPDDPAAHLELGKSWCFVRDRWEKGLPHLAKSNHPILKELAKKDLESPLKPEAQVDLAQAWQDAAQKEKDQTRSQMQRRAYQWYMRAVFQLEGNAQTNVQDKIKELVDLLPARLRVTEIETELKKLTGHTGEVLTVLFSPNGLQALSGSADKTLILWDMAEGKSVQTFTGHFGPVFGADFSPDGKYIFSCSEDKTVRQWETATGKEIKQFTGHDEYLNSVAVSPDGKLLAGVGRQVYLWDMASGKKLHQLAGHVAPIFRVVFSGDGQFLASASDDQTARLWDVKNAKQVQELRGHTGLVIGLAFSPDGKQIATGADDNTIRLWDAASGKELHRFTGHTAIVGALAFSPDGSRLVSASDDRTVRLWDIETGQQVRSLSGHTDAVYGVAFSPDGRWVISCSLDRTVRLWGERK